MIMAPPSNMRIGTLTLVVMQALVLTFLALSTTWVVHAAPVLQGDCPAGCGQFDSTLSATFLFGNAATPLGYQQVSAVCARNPKAQDCPQISTPPFFNSAAPTFRCCNQFTIVTGAMPGFHTSVDVTYDQTITVRRFRVFRRTDQPDWQDNQHISCIAGVFPVREVEFDSPVTLSLGSPQGITYPRVNLVEACYDPFTAPPPGTVTGDPKVVGGDGVAFYFHGRKDHNYCLVSDSDLHINAHFIGKRPAGRNRHFTWVQALGFVYGSHTLTIAAKRYVAQWNPTIDHLEFVYKGEPLSLNPASTWASPGAVMTLTRTGVMNVVEFEIKEKMGVSLNAVPIGKHESDVHHYSITGEDCFVHLDMEFRFYNLSMVVDGVLGQTYRPGFVNPVKRGVAMPVMGGADRFGSSSLLATDCAVSQYTGTALARPPWLAPRLH